MSSGNKNLHVAKQRANDEFYTLYSDIAAEMPYYAEYFKGKVVYCNCDDPRESNFVKYFVANFEQLGLRKLIASGFKMSGVGIMGIMESGDSEMSICPMEGSGDFRSLESQKLLLQADIVVTNPPFSLFRDFVSQLVFYEKDFILLGNHNALVYSEIFSLARAGRLWYGVHFRGGSSEFIIPKSTLFSSKSARVGEDGKCYVRLSFVRWFTTLDHKTHPAPLKLTRHFKPEDYPRYDNYDAINVDRTQDIPCDYDGVMGVPLTFFDKFNPEQFEILGADASRFGGRVGNTLVLNGKDIFTRLLIRRRK